jgi:hypothetical protein
MPVLHADGRVSNTNGKNGPVRLKLLSERAQLILNTLPKMKVCRFAPVYACTHTHTHKLTNTHIHTRPCVGGRGCKRF